MPQKLIDQVFAGVHGSDIRYGLSFTTVDSSDIKVTETGLTISGGSETPEKPVGTMFVFTLIKGREISFRKVLKGSCEENHSPKNRGDRRAVNQRFTGNCCNK